MNEQVNKWLMERLEQLDGPWVARNVARELLTHLQDNDKELLGAWLRSQSLNLVTQRIRWIERNRLRSSRKTTLVRGLQDAALALMQEPDPLSPFEATMTVDEHSTRKRVADMTGGDHVFVANSYGRQGHTALMLEAFHRAVSKRVGKKTTSEALSQAQYVTMYRSIVSPVLVQEATA